MARVEFSNISGIAGISGRVGDLIFYRRGGKQYVRKASRNGESVINQEDGPIMEGQCQDNDPITEGQ